MVSSPADFARVAGRWNTQQWVVQRNWPDRAAVVMTPGLELVHSHGPVVARFSCGGDKPPLCRFWLMPAMVGDARSGFFVRS